ncbi:cupin domain-containing protein [Silvibacterium acidisoli]|uniref:cupin domain-containing protein n=1 Tax=Acidobacteriaceae bacterium ZG23-2 TaxID=2883246 RepID=UPI00406D335E
MAQVQIPPDDLARNLVIAKPDTDSSLTHIGIVGDTYTILLSGEQTGGRFCLVDMFVPPGGGPGLHRHDFEETFIVKDGAIEATFRGQTVVIKAGETVHIPANAPHRFQNNTGQPARLLCICSPAGQEEFFAKLGVLVDGRTTPPPPLSEEDQQEFLQRAIALAPEYRTELIKG